MSNVLNFPQRATPEVSPQISAEAVDAMVKESATMQLVSALAFYSSQGWDGGEKARAAFPALREILARSNINLSLQPSN